MASRLACLFLAVALHPGLAWTQQETLRTKPDTGLPEFAEDNERRIDPGEDQWRSEVLHDAAKPVIKHFLEDLVNGREFSDVSFAADFRCSVLRPELETVYNDRTIAVRRARAIPPEEFGPDRLIELAKAFRAPVGPDAKIGLFMMKLVSVEIDAPDRFRIRVFLHSHAEEQGAVLQWNVELESFWRVGASDEEVALAGIRLLNYEEVSGPSKLLPDHSMTVFGGTPGYREQVLMGTEEWTSRVDRILGKSFFGENGIAVGDVDGDGHDDLYLCQQAGLPNRLWLWRPGGKAVEVSAAMGVDFLDKTSGALIADFDGDGFPDIALGVGSDVAMCWNNGQGKFEPMRLEGHGPGAIYSLAAADSDQDGDLDLYACRYAPDGLMSAVPHPYHDANNGAENIFWRNEGGRRLNVATNEVGLGMNNTRFSLAAAWEDFDDDGDQDLYVANDFGRNNLYLNDKGKFRDVAAERGCEDLASGMGVTFGDVDQDGDADLYVTNMFSSAGRRIATQEDRFMEGQQQELHKFYVRHARGNSLLVNDGRGKFTDVTDKAGVAVGLWGWGSIFFELDNDGRADIYAPNGFLTSAKTVDL
jgi:hypothetical protein